MKMLLRSRKRGSVLVVAALSLGLLLGAGALAVDYGYSVLMKERLQRAVDAAALCGAAELAVGRAQTAATCAVEMGNTNLTANYSVSFPTGNRCRVDGECSLRTFFAVFLGRDSMTVRAHAEAIASPVSEVQGLRPFAIAPPDVGFVYGTTYKIKYGPGDETEAYHGNFNAVALDPDDKGAGDYLENIKYGSDTWIRVGSDITTDDDWIFTEPGNMAGPTREGVNFLVGQDAHDWTYYQSMPGIEISSRLVTIPIIESTVDINGRTLVHVIGFARVFLENAVGIGNDVDVYARFVQIATPNSRVGNAVADYGAYGIRLVTPGS
jgi:hypothetical protein